MEISSVVALGNSWDPKKSASVLRHGEQKVDASDVLSFKEKGFFDRLLHTSMNSEPASATFFSNQAISALNTQEMGFWSQRLGDIATINQRTPAANSAIASRMNLMV